MREGELVAELDGASATELEILRHAMPAAQRMSSDPRDVDVEEPSDGGAST
jgi:hypothetical protein